MGLGWESQERAGPSLWQSLLLVKDQLGSSDNCNNKSQSLAKSIPLPFPTVYFWSFSLRNLLSADFISEFLP